MWNPFIIIALIQISRFVRPRITIFLPSIPVKVLIFSFILAYFQRFVISLIGTFHKLKPLVYVVYFSHRCKPTLQNLFEFVLWKFDSLNSGMIFTEMKYLAWQFLKAHINQEHKWIYSVWIFHLSLFMPLSWKCHFHSII